MRLEAMGITSEKIVLLIKGRYWLNTWSILFVRSSSSSSVSGRTERMFLDEYRNGHDGKLTIFDWVLRRERERTWSDYATSKWIICLLLTYSSIIQWIMIDPYRGKKRRTLWFPLSITIDHMAFGMKWQRDLIRRKREMWFIRSSMTSSVSPTCHVWLEFYSSFSDALR